MTEVGCRTALTPPPRDSCGGSSEASLDALSSWWLGASSTALRSCFALLLPPSCWETPRTNKQAGWVSENKGNSAPCTPPPPPPFTEGHPVLLRNLWNEIYVLGRTGTGAACVIQANTPCAGYSKSSGSDRSCATTCATKTCRLPGNHPHACKRGSPLTGFTDRALAPGEPAALLKEVRAPGAGAA